MSQPAFTSSSKNEITFRVIVLSVILAALLAISNAYLALKIGMLTAASIPAAIISMSILRFFKQATILENNLVQTAASAGEAVAGGIVFSIPALIILQFWQHFAFWENFIISVTGGVLGVIFSVPFRRAMMRDAHLKFPEGRAIAALLEAGHRKDLGLKSLLKGSFFGALIELLQTGLKLFASQVSLWFFAGKTVVGLNFGFSTTMIGAGYLIGIETSFSILLGAVIGWIIGIPVLTAVLHLPITDAAQTANQAYGDHIRYVGIGAMLVAGIYTLLTLLKPIFKSLFQGFTKLGDAIQQNQGPTLPHTEKDLNNKILAFFCLMIGVILLGYLYAMTPYQNFKLEGFERYLFVLLAVIYIFIAGFIFSNIAAYFSGLVGNSASPGSAILIGCILLTAFIMHFLTLTFHIETLLMAEGFTIIIATISFGAAALSNDTIQDLKVGHLIGATPWKQEIMLILGCIISAMVIPFIMQLLFDVYGIGNILPRPGMDITQALPAPPAAATAAITQAVFSGNLPWGMLSIGACLTLAMVLLNFLLRKKLKRELTLIGFAIGIYLPLAISTALFSGGFIAWLLKRKMADKTMALQKASLIACGLVAGSALMDVLLAVPFAISRNANLLQIAIPNWQTASVILSGLSVLFLIRLFYKA